MSFLLLLGEESRKLRVLSVDTNATPLAATDNALESFILFSQRIGASVTQVAYSDLTAAHYATNWDLIVFPYVDNAVTANYSNMATACGSFSGDCPIVIVAASPGGTSAIRAVTGVTGVDSSIGQIIGDVGSEWGDGSARTITNVSLYTRSVPDVTGATIVSAADRANVTNKQVIMWRKDYGSHPTLWITNSAKNSATLPYKPWYYYQWGADKQSTAAKRLAFRSRIVKATCLMRMDIFDNNGATTGYTAGYVQSLYDSAVAHGFDEIWIAAVGQGSTQVGATAANQTVRDYLIARRSTNGGILKFTNHHYDLTDGAGATKGPACTTDGVNLNNSAAALTGYRTSCDALTALGVELGSDGYCAGIPMVMDGNDVNNPSAQFISQTIGAYNWLYFGDAYPNGGLGVLTPEFTFTQNRNWFGKMTIGSLTLDGLGTTTQLTLTINDYMLKMLCLGGSVYLHADSMANFAPWVDHYFSNYSACPDIINGKWTDLRQYVDTRQQLNVAF